MGMPNLTDNYQGYKEADLTNHVDQLRDKQFLLVCSGNLIKNLITNQPNLQIHGTADDNTHFMQTMLLSKALTSRGALFKQQIYPDEGHNLGGVKQHLYRSMTLFFEDCFKKQVSMHSTFFFK